MFFSPNSRKDGSLWALGGLLALALAVRLPLWLGSPGAAFDMDSYGRVAGELLAGHGLYGNPALEGRYPYLPPWALVLLLARGVSHLTGLPFSVCAKAPGVLADLGVTVLLFAISRRTLADDGPWLSRRSLWVALAWAASPLAALVTAGHGQFDSLPLLGMLAAYWLLECSPHPDSERNAALALGAAVAFKTWPIALLPAFLKQLPSPRERLRFTLWALLVPAAVALPFLAWQPLQFARAVSHTGSVALSLPEAVRAICWVLGAPADVMRWAHWGLTGALALLGLGLGLAYLLGPWELELAEALAAGVLTLYVAAPGFCPQYLLWLLPFALLLPGGLAARHAWWGLALALGFYMLFIPEAFLTSRFVGMQDPPAWLLAAWAAANLALWGMFVASWWSLVRKAARGGAALSRPVWA